MIQNYDTAINLLLTNGFKQIEDLRGFKFEKGKKPNIEVLFFRTTDEMFNYLNNYLKSGYLEEQGVLI